MTAFFEKVWPPTKTWRRSILWAFGFGFVLQIALPSLLAMAGAQRAAWLAMLPGLWPILWATGGWFSSIAPMGYVVIYSVNTVFYGMIFMMGFRTSACLHRHHE
jgi:hypothetical protein